MGILKAVQENQRFREDLKALLIKVVQDNKLSFTGESGFFHFTGENMFCRLTGDRSAPAGRWHNADGGGYLRFVEEQDVNLGSLNTTTSVPKTTAPKTSTFSSVFSGQNLGNLFNTGVNTLSTLLTNKSNKDLANTALEIEKEKTQQAAMLAAAAQSGGGAAPPKKGLSTGAKIGIGVGILIVGVLVTWGAIKLLKKKKG
jgi:hypothetical protein